MHELKARSLERDAPLQGSKGVVSVGPCDRDQHPRDWLDSFARTAVLDLRRKGARLRDTVVEAARHRCPAQEVRGRFDKASMTRAAISLFVANAGSGRGTAYDAATGNEVAFWEFQPPGTAAINDVALTHYAAYFTDSLLPFLYRVPLGRRGEPGAVADQIPLPAIFGMPGTCTVGPANRGNGIAAAPNGEHLIITHMSEGGLYRVDTATHTVVPIVLTDGDSLGGGPVCTTDGMLLDGTTLYVSQNFLNRIAIIELTPDHLNGVITGYITQPFASNPGTKVPTTLAEFGSSLYAVTAGFAAPAPDFVVRLPK